MGVFGAIALVGGGVAQLVAWIGALISTAQLEDKTWFLILLLLGIFGLGFIPMLVYVVAGPDTRQRRHQHRDQRPRCLRPASEVPSPIYNSSVGPRTSEILV